MQYHGVRVGNVKCNRTPLEDFGVYYFSSGKFKSEFKDNPSNFMWKICFTFDSSEEAIAHEERINSVASKIKSWANAYGKYIPADAAKNGRQKTLKERYGVDHNFKIPSVVYKRKETLHAKYGYENPSQSEIIKEKKRKTLKSRYGTENPFCLIDVKLSMKEKYGWDNPQRCPDIHNKTLNTNFQRYGVKCTFQIPSVKEKIKVKRQERMNRLSLMSDEEFESYLKTISQAKSIQAQLRSIRKDIINRRMSV